MRSKALYTGLLAAAAIIASAPVANAEYLVPPGNSGATQYTQTVPTAGGGGSTASHDHSDSKEVLGNKKAKKLESKGKAGKEVAEFTAETAPPSVAVEPETSSTEPESEPEKQAGGAGAGKSKGGDGKGGAHHQHSGGGKGSPSHSAPPANTTPTTKPVSTADPKGSSAVGEVAGKMTGFSSEQSGPLLVLVLIGALVWAVYFVAHQRRRPLSR